MMHGAYNVKQWHHFVTHAKLWTVTKSETALDQTVRPSQNGPGYKDNKSASVLRYTYISPTLLFILDLNVSGSGVSCTEAAVKK